MRPGSDQVNVIEARPCLRSAEYSAADTVSPKPARFCVCRGTSRDGDLRWRCDHLGQDTRRSTMVRRVLGCASFCCTDFSSECESATRLFPLHCVRYCTCKISF